MQDAFDSLRTEIQTDRIALQGTISNGFSSVHTKLDEQSQTIGELHGRVTAIENRQNVLGRGLWGLALTFIGGIFTAVIRYFKGS